jgi:hypothetical protein
LPLFRRGLTGDQFSKRLCLGRALLRCELRLRVRQFAGQREPLLLDGGQLLEVGLRGGRLVVAEPLRVRARVGRRRVRRWRLGRCVVVGLLVVHRRPPSTMRPTCTPSCSTITGASSFFGSASRITERGSKSQKELLSGRLASGTDDNVAFVGAGATSALGVTLARICWSAGRRACARTADG